MQRFCQVTLTEDSVSYDLWTASITANYFEHITVNTAGLFASMAWQDVDLFRPIRIEMDLGIDCSGQSISVFGSSGLPFWDAGIHFIFIFFFLSFSLPLKPLASHPALIYLDCIIPTFFSFLLALRAATIEPNKIMKYDPRLKFRLFEIAGPPSSRFRFVQH